jgi:hypothetical protein
MDRIDPPNKPKLRVYLADKTRFPRNDPHAWADYIEDQIKLIRSHLRMQWIVMVVILWDISTRLLAFFEDPFR